jgi:hypothetical protein
MVNQLDARTLKARLHDGGEIALLDAREEVPFDARHLLWRRASRSAAWR